MSKMCPIKGKCTDEDFEECLLEHECDINFTGSSPAMEAEGAVDLWSRSIKRYNHRYKWMVSNDSKAFNSVEHRREREVDVAVYAMKKNIIPTLHHGVESQDQAKHRFLHWFYS